MLFSPLDYYQIDEFFSEEEKLIRRSVHDFVEVEVLPIIEKHYMLTLNLGATPSVILFKKLKNIIC